MKQANAPVISNRPEKAQDSCRISVIVRSMRRSQARPSVFVAASRPAGGGVVTDDVSDWVVVCGVLPLAVPDRRWRVAVSGSQGVLRLCGRGCASGTIRVRAGIRVRFVLRRQRSGGRLKGSLFDGWWIGPLRDLRAIRGRGRGRESHAEGRSSVRISFVCESRPAPPSDLVAGSDAVVACRVGRRSQTRVGGCFWFCFWSSWIVSWSS